MAYMGAPPPYSQEANQGLIHNPNIPYIGPLAPLCDGYMITISGRVLPKADKFHVNLSIGGGLNEQCENAFHINPRFGGKIIVRNSFMGGRWMAEDRTGTSFPLERDQNFEMIILVTNPCFKVAFNGKHFCEFNHRTAKERVTHLVVEGDVLVHSIKITDPRATMAPAGQAPAFSTGPPPVQGAPGFAPPPQGYPPPVYGSQPGMPQAPGYPAPGGYPPPPQGCAPPHNPPFGGYPPAAGCVPGVGMNAGYPTGKAPPPQAGYPPQATGYQPPGPPRPQAAPKPVIPVPFTQALRRGLEAGMVIRIHGKPRSNAKEMRFDFCCNNQDLIAFHFNPRLNQKVVVRNSRSGSWGKEERQQPKFPFLPDKEFDMIIYCDPNKYQVTIDGENFISFNHRIRNLANIRFLKISGDIDLYSVQI